MYLDRAVISLIPAFCRDSGANRVSFVPSGAPCTRREACLFFSFHENCQFSLTPPLPSYFHFRRRCLAKAHTQCLSASFIAGDCAFPQVCQSQGPCFKFIISCLKDEKPICLRGVWKPLEQRHDRMSCSENAGALPSVCVCVSVCL